MKKLLGCFLCVMLLTFGAQAHALMITPSSTPQWSGPETSQDENNSIIIGYTGYNDALYKQDEGGGESGDLAGSYETEFFDIPTDPSGATITYTGGDIVGPPAFLLVKDGNHTPGWYLFGLNSMGWDGMDTLTLEGFWPNQ
ncbi:MAG: hypothetical protein JRI92_07305, partial [Deltaproteobacteria bacterium]|nr:hypothetical protein [Deltaproteobacteria bacterium]